MALGDLDLSDLNLALLLSAAVLLVAVGAVRLATRAGLPSLLIYLGIGIAIGENGLGLRFDDAQLAQNLGLAALVVILTEGGLTTRWASIRRAVPVAATLSTLGVAVSIAITAVAAKYVLDTGWRVAVLLGAIVSSTDAAAVFATLRRLRVRPRLVGVLEAEAGFNDAPVVIVVMLLSADATVSPGHLVAELAFELAVGGAIGIAVGVLGAILLRRSALPAAGLYPLGVFGFAVVAYAAAGLAGASGFLAVYLSALLLGNADLPHRRATLAFAEGVAWLAQIGLFVLLGLLVTPAQLPAAILPALAIGGALLLLARPASVLASTAAFRLPGREQAFLAWSGLRGAVPIVLATIPLTLQLGGSRSLFNIVFVLVVVFTLVQGPTLAPLARLLGVTADAETREVRVEAAPLEDLHADLLQLRIPARSRLHGVEVGELRLPPGTAVTLVVRDGASFVPGPATSLRTGDDLLLVATAGSRVAAERRLRAVSRRGKLAGWFGERGEES